MKLKIIKYLKENNIEFYMCRICSEIVDKNHFETEEHIEKFNSVCKIEMDKSLIVLLQSDVNLLIIDIIIYILIYILKKILEK